MSVNNCKRADRDFEVTNKFWQKGAFTNTESISNEDWTSLSIYVCVSMYNVSTRSMKKILRVSSTNKNRILGQSVQSLSHVPLFAAPWTAAWQASLSITSSQSWPKLMFIQPSPPLSSPSPPALNLSQHQGLFQWVSSLYQVAKVLEFQLQHQSFQWTPRTDLL